MSKKPKSYSTDILYKKDAIAFSMVPKKPDWTIEDEILMLAERDRNVKHLRNAILVTIMVVLGVIVKVLASL